jgi:hypothetical protein
MIKQFTFVNRRRDVHRDGFPAVLREVLEDRALGGPSPAVRPRRVALCTVLPGEGRRPRHDAVCQEWFDDEAHLGRFQEWRSAVAPSRGVMDAVADPGLNPVVVAAEVVRRGAEWLEARWRERGPKFKHMAIARRAGHLTPAEFSQRWLAHAGTVSPGGASGDLVIPHDVRGLSYVQDHPLPRDDDAWAYDAINEVYFDDLEGLRRRARWFEENVGRNASEDLFGQRWFLCVREDVLVAA